MFECEVTSEDIEVLSKPSLINGFIYLLQDYLFYEEIPNDIAECEVEYVENMHSLDYETKVCILHYMFKQWNAVLNDILHGEHLCTSCSSIIITELWSTY